MREVVRSGRRANFYITENSFIDHYAKEVGTTGVAVYHVLQRHANCETHSTWIGTAKMAKLLGLEQRTIQRTIKKLESLKLIRIVRSENVTTFYIDPVPTPAKVMSAPLFDALPDSTVEHGDTDVAHTTSQSWPATVVPPNATSWSGDATVMSPSPTPMPHTNDVCVAPYKEEQNFYNKTSKQENFLAKECAQRILEIFKDVYKWSPSSTQAGSVLEIVTDIVTAEVQHTGLSMNGSVSRITTAANRAHRSGITPERFLDNFLPRIFAKEIIEALNLPATSNFIYTIAESLKTEAKRLSLSLDKAAEFIASEASEDQRRGVATNTSYFENTKWRSGNGNGRGKSKAEQNLDAAIGARNSARRALGLDH
jgi:hypothetical protein